MPPRSAGRRDPFSESPQGRRPRCLDMLAELSDYLDGDLSPARCRTIDRHLERCPCCDNFAAALRDAIAVCRDSGVRRLPPAVRARAMRRIAALLADGPVTGARARPEGVAAPGRRASRPRGR